MSDLFDLLFEDNDDLLLETESIPPEKELEDALAWILNRGGIVTANDFCEEYDHSVFTRLQSAGRVSTVVLPDNGTLYYTVLGD